MRITPEDEFSVSVIIPAYNAAPWIAECISSCLEQQLTPLEIIVVDDGSTDRTLEIAKSFASHLRVESRPHLGGNSARNFGLSISRAKLIQFLDADDILLPNKIQSQVLAFSDPSIDIVYGDWRYKNSVKSDSFLGPVVEPGVPANTIEALLSNRWWVPPVAVLFRRSAIEKVHGWDESIAVGQDRDLMLRLAIAGCQSAYVNDCQSIYRFTHESLSRNNRRWMDGHAKLVENAKGKLISQNRFSSAYQRAIGIFYAEHAAKNIFKVNWERSALYIQSSLSNLSHIKFLVTFIIYFIRVTVFYLILNKIKALGRPFVRR